MRVTRSISDGVSGLLSVETALGFGRDAKSSRLSALSALCVSCHPIAVPSQKVKLKNAAAGPKAI
ncbi:MAG TPA: hypothetical protein PK867_16525, partial [Pirellulales bacterium]|nr:hypothetical protein [Pirellulales bacterium]